MNRQMSIKYYSVLATKFYNENRMASVFGQRETVGKPYFFFALPPSPLPAILFSLALNPSKKFIIHMENI